MVSVTVTNVPDELHRALRARAALHGRSTEDEVRDILETAVRPPGRVKIGSLLADLGREAGLTDADCAVFDQRRDAAPLTPVDLE
ncbi:MAG: FitA-like ribbon-helix-helix domain-containing protein [Niveispirillum sp.]|uniref:FitA-like ribbon-helix-helix domain-containing protein n=1 Tax=Niveispirillum sp. TaxID=1917217 RepID=UPI003BA4A3E5